MGKMTRTPGPGLEAFQKMISDSDKMVAKVGYFPSAHYPDGTPIAYIASIHEFGVPSRSIPARPTMRPTIDKYGKEWKSLMGKGMASVARGKRSVRDVFDAISGLAAGEVRKAIAELDSPPLSKITLLARKFKKDGGVITSGKQIGEFAEMIKNDTNIDLSGVSDKPLNDTGAMMAHLTNVVEEK